MSAKIYNGFMLPGLGFPEVDAFLRSYRTVVARQHKKAFCKLMACDMMQYLDDAATQALRPGDERLFDAPPMLHALTSIWDRQKKLKDTGRRDPQVDFQFELWVFFHQNTFYGIAQCEQQEWLRAFFRHPAVKPSHYWGNSDKPANLSEKEWDARGQLWGEILGPSRIPSDTCWTVSLSSEALMPQMSNRQDKALLKAGLPGWDERVSQASQDIAWLRWLREVNRTAPNREAGTPSGIVARLREFRAYTQSPEGLQQRQAIAQEVQGLLLRDPAMEVFLNPPQHGSRADNLVASPGIPPKL